MSTVFLDTVGLIALVDTRDQWHAAAEAAWMRIVADREATLTTSLVLVECANAAARRPYRTAIVRLRESLTRNGNLIDPIREEWEFAWQNYARGDAASASVVDQLSFMVMKRFGLTRAFTDDRHFSAAEIEVLF